MFVQCKQVFLSWQRMATLVIPPSASLEEILYINLMLHSFYSSECGICRAVWTQLFHWWRKMLDMGRECHLKAKNVQTVPPRAKIRALQRISHLLVAVLLQPDWRWGVHRVLGGLEQFLGNSTFSVSFYYLVLFSSKICVWIHSYPSPWCRRWQQSPHMSKWPMVITLRQVRVCADFAIIGQLVVLQMKGQYIYN